MGDRIRWGLMGAGALLTRWMRGAREAADEAEIAAISSRTIETARRQAEAFGIPEAMTYEEMLKRQDLDVIYILTPHTAHRELAIKAMEAGFPVVVEKPAAVTAADWRSMAACAAKNRVFLMEAVWTRCFPLTEKLQAVLKAKRIGEVRQVESTFAFRTPGDYKGRLFDPMQAGGALLDVGVYGLHFAQLVFGKCPAAMTALMTRDSDALHLAVDESCVILSRYDDGALAVTKAAIRTEMPDTAWIFGTEGYIRIPDYWKPERMEIVSAKGTECIELPVQRTVPGDPDEGYQYEIRHVCDCIRSGAAESPLVPHALTEAVLAECDAVRRQCGLSFPFET